MMKHKLYTKYIFSHFIFLLLSGLLLFTVVPGMVRQSIIHRRADYLQTEAQQLASCLPISGCDYKGSEAETVAALLDCFAKAQDAEIWLTTDAGRILMCTRLDYPLKNQLFIPAFSSLTAHKAYWFVSDFQGLFHQQVLSAIAPVLSANRTTEYVIVHYPLSRLSPHVNAIRKIFSFYYFLILLLSTLMPLCFFYFYYRPLLDIVHASTDYTNRSLNHQLPVRSNDEYSKLCANLNYMAQEINQSGEYQRKFISNISHDFRSPLTSIKGYAEAILDGTIPKEDQEKYLNIILSETERLAHLTQNLLTLNNFDDRGTLLNISAFDINEVIRSIAASFEIQCRKKDMKIFLSLSSGQMAVKGDKEKIQQVLYNLLDNAVKFSDTHSSIRLTITRKQKKVFISVKDSGEGISKANLPRIWDRFYKSDSSRGRDKKGTGLGLAIVKEIIQAHNQNINVISTEGVGTEFIFTLDKA